MDDSNPRIAEGSELWSYLSPAQRVLAGDGAFLAVDGERHRDEEPTDYSYLVFPFAKLYEGFLKQLFYDLEIISDRDYASEHFRIGKALSPSLVRRLKNRSAYGQVTLRYGKPLATRLWNTWKNGRNMVFHYFPQNYRALTLEHAKILAADIVDTMQEAITITKVQRRGGRED